MSGTARSNRETPFNWRELETAMPKVAFRITAEERRLLQMVLIERKEGLKEFFMNYARPMMDRIERAGHDIPRNTKQSGR
jgi:hypothetical protein